MRTQEGGRDAEAGKAISDATQGGFYASWSLKEQRTLLFHHRSKGRSVFPPPMAGVYVGKGVSLFALCIFSLSRVQISAWARFLPAGCGYRAKENSLLIPGTSDMRLTCSDVNVSLDLLNHFRVGISLLSKIIPSANWASTPRFALVPVCSECPEYITENTIPNQWIRSHLDEPTP